MFVHHHPLSLFLCSWYTNSGDIMNENWIKDAVFYHIYPLGFCGAPRFAHEETEIRHRILKIIDWIPHLQEMSINALYLGPIFASYEHGYDTSDYRMLDPRLGTNEDFQTVCDALHEAGIRIVLDGVFHHVGRSFWAFKDLCENKEQSPYKDWFSNLDFHRSSPYGDPFSYEAWEGHYNLVKLNLRNEEVISHLLESVGMWMDAFHIDGLRLDAADRIDHAFFQRLHTFTKTKNPQFWLMGEIIHGNYRVWANDTMLDSVTNYECYKGLYSSHNTKNYFEIAHSLNRQFAKGGIYEDLCLYNFADNHDVNRLASVLTNPNDSFNLYTILYTMPGIPSLYYGSEFSLTGTKHDGSDADIRPALTLEDINEAHPLYRHICMLGKLRHRHCALRGGSYEQVVVRNEQLIYRRADENEVLYIACNLADTDATLQINETELLDLFHGTSLHGTTTIDITLPPHDSALYKVIQKPASPMPHQADHPHAETAEEALSGMNDKQNDTTSQSEASRLQPLPQVPLGKYRHFKGKEYALLYIAYHSETLEPMAVYRQLYADASLWVRPLSMFLETVESDDGPVPRFSYIGK